MDIREIRKARGYTQSYVAEKSGVSRRTIQDWERFGTDRARLGELRKVAKVLGVSIIGTRSSEDAREQEHGESPACAGGKLGDGPADGGGRFDGYFAAVLPPPRA